MATRTVYHVLPGPAGWLVKKGKAAKASAAHVRKTQALRAAGDLARSHPLAQVVVHNAAGVITSDRTYGPKDYAKKKKKRAVVRKIKQAKVRRKRRQLRSRTKRRKAAKLGLARAKRVRQRRSAAAQKAARSRAR